MEQDKSFIDRVESRKKEMYQEYLDETLDIIFNGSGKENNNTIRFKVENDIEIPDDKNEGYDYFEGYRIVRNYMGRYDYINKRGNKLIGETGEINYNRDHVEGLNAILHDFNCGRALILEKGSRFRFLSLDEPILKGFDDARDFSEGYALVKRNGKWNYIDVNGDKVLDEDFDYGTDVTFGRARIRRGMKLQTVYLGMRDYKVSLTFGGYFCSNATNHFKIKHQPVKMFNDRNILCIRGNNYCLYDIKTNQYIPVGNTFDICYDDNLIYDKRKKIVYLPYKNRLVDITDYYQKKLINKGKISIDYSIDRILSLDDLAINEVEKLEEIMEEERKKHKEIIDKQEKVKKQREIDQRIQEDKANKEIAKEKRLEGLRKIKEGLELLQKYGKGAKLPRIQYNFDFDLVNDHKEFPRELIKVLKYLDLSLVDFTNVKVSGIDFRGCNIEHLDPQIVYNKDLSNSNFEGIFMRPFISFEGVDIRGSKFSYDDNNMTINVLNESLSRAIYDDTTTFNGIPLTEIFKNKGK